eukprot:13428111-Alexandrium_andersonii.AAC.1
MMRFSNFTSCKSEGPPPSLPSTLHMNLSFMNASTASRSSPYPVKVKSSPCTTRRTSSAAW